jgi:RNA recognition motif-containing protein
LFITGITKKLKNSEVKKYFGCFGKVKDVKLMPSKTGKGMGFVVFSDSDSVAKILAHAKVHKIAKHKVRTFCYN